MTNFAKKWTTYTQAYITNMMDNPNEDECSYKSNDMKPKDLQNYIIRSIEDTLDERVLEKLPLTGFYTSEAMSELDKLIYLIKETQKLTMPCHSFMESIIYDLYDINNGTQGLYDIISRFMIWTDVNIPTVG